MSNTTSPNMGLIIPGIGTESGPTWASDINADLASIDSHDHSPGKGVQITPNGLNINSDLAFQSNNATQLRSTRFAAQVSVLSLPADIGCLYVVGNELYYNDVSGGNNVQITANGSVNATSSGISSGTASASFSAGVLVVKSSSTSGANVLMQSAVLTNSGNLSNQLTLSAPTLSGSLTETLPEIPGSTSFMTMDSSGNMGATIPIAQGITRTNLASVGQQISASCGSFTTTSTSPVDVTNLSVTITTSGRPVIILIQPDGSAFSSRILSGSTGAVLQILRGSTSVYNADYFSTGASLLVAPASICLDAPTSGTYTYSVQMSSTGGGSVGLANAVLVAYEL